MTTGEKIKNLRSRYGASMSQLAKLTRIPLRNIMLWESGQRNPPPYIYDYCVLALQKNWEIIAERAEKWKSTLD